jgi:hypothetical protein
VAVAAPQHSDVGNQAGAAMIEALAGRLARRPRVSGALLPECVLALAGAGRDDERQFMDRRSALAGRTTNRAYSALVTGWTPMESSRVTRWTGRSSSSPSSLPMSKIAGRNENGFGQLEIHVLRC